MPALDAAAVKARAAEIGFDLCGIAGPAGYPELGRLRAWLDEGHAGTMQYLARSARRREDVRAVMPSVASVIVVAMAYQLDRPYSPEIADPAEAEIARYARGDDYHEVIGARLDALVAWMTERSAVAFEARTYVDTGPVQERVYAQHAGLGWIGKNTCLINPRLGSWLLLGEALVSLPLEPDASGLDQCGTCSLCLDACPTGALVEPWTLDARRCLSYLTIELKGPTPVDWRPAVGTHVFGCDICQEVCPWNLPIEPAGHREWGPRLMFDRPALTALWAQSDAALSSALASSAMSRAGLVGLRRNVAIALGNTGLLSAAEALAASTARAAKDAPSLAHPVVAEHVEWAADHLRRRREPTD
jgi:epoxyqueuosine reductase